MKYSTFKPCEVLTYHWKFKEMTILFKKSQFRSIDNSTLSILLFNGILQIPRFKLSNNNGMMMSFYRVMR